MQRGLGDCPSKVAESKECMGPSRVRVWKAHAANTRSSVRAQSIQAQLAAEAPVDFSANQLSLARKAPAKDLVERNRPTAALRTTHNPWHVTPRVLEDVVTMFNTMPYEHDYWVEKTWVTGQIPHELQGTYYRNGPGLQVSSGKHQRHFMDGDGCVLSLAFPGGGAAPRFTNRYVRTKGFMDEQAAGKPVHRNAFTRGAADGSSLFNPLDLNFKNVANTGVLYWAGRMWALWEVGLPYELNPRTLDTLGESTMEGQISQRLAAHYRVITEQDGEERLVLFGAQVSFSGIHLEFHELDREGKTLATSQHALDLGGGMDIMFVHDLLVTDHWYLIIMGPVELDVKGFFTDYLASKRSLAELLIYNKDKMSKVYLFPRPGKTPPPAAGPLRSHVLTAPPFFSFHHVNAYESEGGSEVVMDTISWQDIAFDVTQYTVTPPYYEGGCRSQLYRLVAHLPSSSITQCDRLVRRTVEFPAINMAWATGKPYRHAYFSADAVDHETRWAPAQALLKVTLPVHGDDTPGTSTAAPSTSPTSQLFNHVVPWQPPQQQPQQHQQSQQPQQLQQQPQQPQQQQHHQHHQQRAGQHQQPGDSQSGVQGSSSPPSQVLVEEDRSDGGGDMQGVMCEEWRPGPRSFPQEPMFIPRPNATSEDDGWIILGVHNAETMKGEIAILDAQRISAGPLAVIHLPHALPCGLHGAWTPEYMGPEPGDTRTGRNKIREL